MHMSTYGTLIMGLDFYRFFPQLFKYIYIPDKSSLSRHLREGNDPCCSTFGRIYADFSRFSRNFSNDNRGAPGVGHFPEPPDFSKGFIQETPPYIALRLSAMLRSCSPGILFGWAA